MISRGLIAAAAGLLAVGVLQAGAAPLADGTIAGRVAAALRPTAGSVTDVRAIDASNLTIARGGSVTRAGTYSLTVAPGVYLVTVDKLGARAAPARGFSRLVRVSSGRKASPPEIVRRPQSRQRSRLVRGKPAVAVKAFAVSGPDAIPASGVDDMLETDLVASPCVVLIEWRRRAELLAEIRLQQSRRVDPSTRVTPRLIQPDIFVEGSVATTRSAVSAVVRMREAGSGRIIASASATGGNVFEAEAKIARQLREKLKEYCIPSRFEGTFSGENRVAGKNSYSGTIAFVRNPTSPQGTVTYRVERVQWRHAFTADTPCVIDANTTVTGVRPDPRLSVLVLQTQKTGTKGYGYAITAFFTSPQQLTITATCNGTQFMQPWVPGAALNTGPDVYSDLKTIEGRYDAPGAASTYTWNLKASG